MSAAAKPLADVLEKEWQTQVVQLARTVGFELLYHTHDSRRSAHGFPDLCLLRERLILLELKREQGKLSEHQRTWLRALLNAGSEIYLVRPRDLQALAQVLALRGPPGVVGYELREQLRAELA